MLEDKSKLELNMLILALMDGHITDSWLAELDEWLRKSPEARAHYREFMHTQVSMRKVFGSMISVDGYDISQYSNVVEIAEESAKCDDTDAFGKLFQVSLEEEQQTAEADALENSAYEQDNNEPSPDLRRCKSGNVPRLGRFFIKAACVTFIICLGLVLLDRWLIKERSSAPQPVVAHLVDEIDAVWDQSLQYPFDDGRILRDEYRLKEGFASIRLESGVELTIEAPAEWSLNSKDNMELINGRIYAVVPEEARGFSVTAGNAKIVDRGTEFGVEVDNNKITQLHVTKGRTILFYGLKKGKKYEKHVNEGMAVQTDKTGNLRDIRLALNKFVRHINSETALVLNGQTTFDLADIVGGGNGLGNGKMTWLDVQTGQFTYFGNADATEAFARYVKVAASDYIDGVFTPDGGSWEVQVSSAGHIFHQCPDTEGVYQYNISNGHEIITSPRENRVLSPPVLAGKKYGTKEDPVIILTTNKGITFDLDAMRKVIPDVDIQKFTAICGLAERNVINGVCQKYGGGASFWVLVDGQVRFKVDKIQRAGTPVVPPAEINVPLNRNNKFLTLIATDGVMHFGEFRSNIAEDYSIFAKPVLHLGKGFRP